MSHARGLDDHSSRHGAAPAGGTSNAVPPSQARRCHVCSAVQYSTAPAGHCDLVNDTGVRLHSGRGSRLAFIVTAACSGTVGGTPCRHDGLCHHHGALQMHTHARPPT